MLRILVMLVALTTTLVASAYDTHFDYTSFDNPNTPGISPHFGQAQFNVLNYPSINGNYMMTSTDTHRPEMIANNNALAEFYNNFPRIGSDSAPSDYNKQKAAGGLDAVAEADAINSYTVSNSTRNGVRPTYVILNELSPSLTYTDANYRQWVLDTVTRLHDTYGYNVITYSPFANPASGIDTFWQALAAKSNIAVENYLSGTGVMNHGTDYASRVAWAQAQYAWSITAFGNRGVPASKLFVSEHFGNTVAGTPYGRSGLSASDWDMVIQIRQDAIRNCNYAGFLAYSWGSNGMGITEAEQIEHEYYYRSRLVLPTQKPQWLSDDAINVNGTVHRLSWSDQLNWLGGVPDRPGAEVNFWRTITADRTITLDGSKTLGTLLFDSTKHYTISSGTGGSLVFNNSSSAATLTSNQGNHTIATGVQLISALNTSVNSGSTVTISGAVSGAAGLTKTGPGTLALTGANSYLGDTAVQAGKLSLTNRGLTDSADVLLSTGGTLELTFSGIADIIDSLFINGVSQPVGIWGAPGSGAQYTSSLLAGTGTLQVTTFVPSFLEGDYSRNGFVDVADYVTWRRLVGTTTIANRDPDNTGVVGTADYSSWMANFGQRVPGASDGLGESAAVPEPEGLLILAFGALSTILNVRPRRTRFASLL